MGEGEEERRRGGREGRGEGGGGREGGRGKHIVRGIFQLCLTGRYSLLELR